MIRVLKRFVTPTVTCTAHDDESELHIYFNTHHIIGCMRETCILSIASDQRFKMLCYADFIIYRSSRQKCVAYLFLNSPHY